ncbi:hypothetical protein HAX54_048946 [Datura stramonium]|uniref:Uncharacterized protein n=1 Tax=Datura stramonium TaxID=4076 RepID=A0ABS8SUU1_DATST|nr:hypothetical protein [Datura stramonium]
MDDYSGPPTVVDQRTKKGKKQRHAVMDDEDDPMECSGKSCRGCTGGLIADCVAVCCCPCALVVNILALAFLKIPWMAGRKCLRMVKKKKRKDDKSNYSTVEEGEVGTSGIVTCTFGELQELVKDDTCFRAEQVWLELYQVGHMGFGRVSFSSQGKPN